MGLVLTGAFLHVPPTYPKPPLPPHRTSQGYLAGCSTSIHAPTMLGARLGLRLVTALLGEMWPQLWPSPAPISCSPPYVYSTERAESKSSHAYYLKVYARYHYP